MKNLLFMLLLLLSIGIDAQNNFYGSYTYRQENDTIKFNSSGNSNILFSFYSLSQDSAIHQNNFVNVKIPDSGELTTLSGQSASFPSNRIIFRHNDAYKITFYPELSTGIDLSQLRTLTDISIIRSGDSFINTSFNNSLVNLYFNSGAISSVDLSNNPFLEKLILQQLNGLNSINISTNTRINWVQLENCHISSVNLGTPNASCTLFNASGNYFPQSEIDEILKWLNDSGSEGGSVNLTGANNSCPSATGFTYVSSLTAKGWSVSVNTCGGSQPPTVTTAQPTYVSRYSATVGGSVVSQGSSSVSQRGVCYGTSINPDINGDRTTNGTGLGGFSSSISGLTPSTQYYVRAYATNSFGTSYGSQYTFTTLAEVTNPTLTTNLISGISTNTATSGGHIISDGGDVIVEKGVCYGTSPNPTYAGTKTNDGSGVADYTSTMTGLSPNTTYYVRAYARNRTLVGSIYVYALGYGQEEAFTTTGDGTLPTVQTYVANTITSSSAYSGGNVISDGGSSVTARGVCWSLNQNPTISNSKTIDGSGTGNFTSSITGLSCGNTYYVRAYATNSAGTAYGNQISFVPNNYPLIIANLSGYAANQSGCISIGGYWTVTLSSPATSNLIIPITITNGTNNGDVNYNIPISYGNTTGSISVNYYLQSSPWIASGSIQSVPCGYSIGTSANINIPVCSPTLNIGDSYGGGIIAYIYQPSDAGYISGEVHGIICANSDETFGRNWSDFQHVISTNTGLGYGTQNTNNIVSYFGAGTYAARLCYDSTRGGYSDWTLPSKDELNKLYQLRLLGYGGFSITNSYTSLYWTSSQSDSANAWVQSFYDGTQNIRNIIAGVAIRAIRYF